MKNKQNYFYAAKPAHSLLLITMLFAFSATAFAQKTTTDLSSVSKASQNACRTAVAKQMNTKLKNLRVTEVSLDRMAFRTLFLRQTKTGKGARCQVNPSNNSIVKIDLEPYDKNSGGDNGSGSSTAGETILEFQTKTYRVQVIRKASGTTLMSVYNKGTDRYVLQDNPAVTAADSGYSEYQACTTNRNPCNGTGYNARLTDSGKKSLTVKQNPNSTGTTEFQIQ